MRARASTVQRAFVRLAHVAPLVVVRIAGALLAGILAVYVARLYGASYSGEFFYLVSTLTITSVVTRLGAEPFLAATITSRARGARDASASYVATTFLAVAMLVSIAGLSLAALQVVAPGVASTLAGDLPAPLLAAAVLGLNSSWIATGYHRALGRSGTSIFLETGLLSLWLLGLLEVSRWFGNRPDATGIACALALLLPTVAIPLLPSLYAARHRLLPRNGVREALAGIAGFGAVTVTNGIIILIPLQVLGWYGLVDEAGIYNAGLRVSMFIGAFGVVVKSIIIRQRLHGTSGIENRQRDVALAALSAIPWILISVGISTQGHLLTQLFGSEFADLNGIILIMLLGQCINVAAFTIETKAVLADERRTLNIASTTTLVIALTLSIALIHVAGLTGAAWAFALTIVVSRAILVTLYLRGDSRRAVGQPG